MEALTTNANVEIFGHMQRCFGYAMCFTFVFIPYVWLLARVPSTAVDARGVPQPVCTGLNNIEITEPDLIRVIRNSKGGAVL